MSNGSDEPFSCYGLFKPHYIKCDTLFCPWADQCESITALRKLKTELDGKEDADI